MFQSESLVDLFADPNYEVKVVSVTRTDATLKISGGGVIDEVFSARELRDNLELTARRDFAAIKRKRSEPPQ